MPWRDRSRFHASLAAHPLLHTPEDEDDLMLAPVYLPVSFKNIVFKEIRCMIQQSHRISWLLYRFSTIPWIKLQSEMKFPTENPRKPGNWNPPPGRYISMGEPMGEVVDCDQLVVQYQRFNISVNSNKGSHSGRLSFSVDTFIKIHNHAFQSQHPLMIKRSSSQIIITTWPRDLYGWCLLQ